MTLFLIKILILWFVNPDQVTCTLCDQMTTYSFTSPVWFKWVNIFQLNIYFFKILCINLTEWFHVRSKGTTGIPGAKIQLKKPMFCEETHGFRTFHRNIMCSCLPKIWRYRRRSRKCNSHNCRNPRMERSDGVLDLWLICINMSFSCENYEGLRPG